MAKRRISPDVAVTSESDSASGSATLPSISSVPLPTPGAPVVGAEAPKLTGYQRQLQRLSPAAVQALSPESTVLAKPVPADVAAARQFTQRLSPAAQQALAEEAPVADVWLGKRIPRYQLVVVPEGGWPTLQTFENKNDMAEAIRKLEGQDVCAIPLFGLRCSLSKGPNRMLLLPDNTAVQLTPALAMVDVMNSALELQDDFFLGLPEWTIASNPAAVARRRASVQVPEEDEFEEHPEVVEGTVEP
jgi:hypothetical protein